MQDLRFATRQLRINAGFTLTAILMLSLGMGASTAIFAFVDAALIKPLPYTDPTRLVSPTETAAIMGRANLSYPDYLDWKRMNNVFTSLDGCCSRSGRGMEKHSPRSRQCLLSQQSSPATFPHDALHRSIQ